MPRSFHTRQPSFAFPRPAQVREEILQRRALKRGRLRETARIGLAVLAVASVPLGFLAWKDGNLATWRENSTETLLQLSAAAGFRLEQIRASGQARTPDEAIVEALGLGTGDPLFAFDMAELRTRVEMLPWVRRAVVSRDLPATLRVFIEERQPVARWQLNGEVALVDAEGAAIPNQALLEFSDLPLLVGPGAPAEGARLLALLQSEPELAARVVAAVRVGSRRWDLEFDNGKRLKLPEETAAYGPAAAWAEFAKLAREDGALAMEVVSFDLRLPGRIVMKMTAGGEKALNQGDHRT